MSAELSPLWKALLAGQSEVALQILQESGANQINVNEYCILSNGTGSTPLMFAVWQSNKQLVNHLIASGADVNAHQIVTVPVNGDSQAELKPEGPTALCLAANKGDTDMISTLLQAGADITAGINQDMSPLSLKIENSPLLCAATHGHVAAVCQLIEEAGADPFTCCQDQRVSTMALAAENMEILARWLELVVQREGTESPEKEALKISHLSHSLYLAVELGLEKAIKMLLDANPDPNDSTGRTDQKTALLAACELRRSTEIVAMLLEGGADPNLRQGSSTRKTPMHDAAIHGDLELLELLVAKGGNIRIGCHFYSTNPDHYEGVKTYDEDEDPDNDPFDGLPNEVLPCHFAAFAGHRRLVEWFCQYPGMLNVHDSFGYSMLHYAVSHRHTDIVTFLLESGANLQTFCQFSPPVPEVGIYGFYSALHIAAWRNDAEIAALLIQNGAVLDERAGMPGENEIGISKGPTALHCAVLGTSQEVVDALLAAGSDLKEQCRAGAALHLACWRGNVAMVSKLVELGADVSLRGQNENTPLHEAAGTANEWQPVEKVAVLLKAGAEVDVMNVHEATPLHLAAQQMNARAVKMLLDAGADSLAKDYDGETPLDVLLQEITVFEPGVRQQRAWQERGIPTLLLLIAAGDKKWNYLPESLENLELGLGILWDKAPEDISHFFRKLGDEVKIKMQTAVKVMHGYGLYLEDLRMRILIEAFAQDYKL